MGKKPNFNNLLKVLDKRRPDGPVLFEFFLNNPLYKELAGEDAPAAGSDYEQPVLITRAFAKAGYDYVNLHASNFGFPRPEKKRASTLSLNDGACVTDAESFAAYEWQDPETADYSHLDVLKNYLEDGMKIIAYGPSGVLENTINLVGYDNLCLMVHDDPVLVAKIFDAVGERLLRTYEIAVKYDAVGAIIGNDDWGFNTQTMLSPADMRKYVFPWHKKIVAAAHAAGKPAILHSCGNLKEVMGDVIDDIKYDGKHSYEDAIQPVEDAYEEFKGKIAIMGGIDVDYICRKSPDEITKRCKAMLERAGSGGFAMGSGNSIPEYVPWDGYFAMINSIY